MLENNENLEKQKKLMEIVDYLSSNDEKSTNIYTKKRLRLFSELMNGMSFSLYDNKELLKKFPDGFVTENIVAIPVDLFYKVEEKYKEFKVDNDSQLGLAKFMLSYVAKLVESKMSITITESEVNKVLSVYKKDFLKSNTEEFKVNPEVTTNNALLNFVKAKVDTNENSIKDFVKSVSKENKSLFQIILSNRMITEEFPSINKLLQLNRHEREFIKNYNFSGMGIMLAKIDTLVKRTDKNVLQFLKSAEKELFPMILDLPISNFQMAVIEMDKQLFRKNKDNYKPEKYLELREIFTNTINNLNLRDEQRNSLFYVISSFNAFKDYKSVDSQENLDKKLKFKN